MTEQARGPREPLLAAAERPQPAPLAGGGKRPISLVTREELRDLNREVSGAGRGGGGGGDGVAPHHLPAMRRAYALPSNVCRNGENWRKSGAANCWRCGSCAGLAVARSRSCAATPHGAKMTAAAARHPVQRMHHAGPCPLRILFSYAFAMPPAGMPDSTQHVMIPVTTLPVPSCALCPSRHSSWQRRRRRSWMAGWTKCRTRLCTAPQPRSGRIRWPTSAVSGELLAAANVLPPAALPALPQQQQQQQQQQAQPVMPRCRGKWLDRPLLTGHTCQRHALPAQCSSGVSMPCLLCCPAATGIASEAGRYGLCIVRAPVAPSVPGGLVSCAVGMERGWPYPGLHVTRVCSS